MHDGVVTVNRESVSVQELFHSVEQKKNLTDKQRQERMAFIHFESGFSITRNI